MTNPWHPLPSDSWFDTLETLHLWTQIVGKIRMAKNPWLNHSWSVPLYVTSRGLGTSLVPHGNEGFELDFDFQKHALELRTTAGETRSTPLEHRTVADFYAAVTDMMSDAGLPVDIRAIPTEIPDATPFAEDTKHKTYEPEHAHALWRALLQASRVMRRFRAGYRGKASPVHFFWGSFDLAVTRFSGRTAPAHSGGLPNFPLDVAQEAYSHEVSSVGFWPGNREAPDPIFYAYAYPSPEGYKDAKVAPDKAMWLDALGEFILPYEAVVSADDPDASLMAFFESTHAAAAELAKWDRSSLECDDPHGPDWWIDRPHST